MLIHANSFKFKKIKNRFSIARNYAKGRTKLNSFPVEAIIEITNMCNLSCIMCPRPNMERPVKYMSFELFKKIIDDIKEHVELVYLSGGLGEPTMHKEFGRMISYCKENKVKVGVSTNATLLVPAICETIFKAKPDILLLSLDGATKEVHEMIRVGSSFETTMQRVEYFLTEKAKHDYKLPHTVVQMIYMPENEDQVDMFRKKWTAFGSVDDVRLKKFLHLQGADHVPEEGQAPALHSKSSCILPWRQVSISCTGDVGICCRDLDFKKVMGNANFHKVTEIWNMKAFQDVREKLATGRKSEIDMCKNCAGMPTNTLTRMATIAFDDLSIRKILPYAEKFALKTGIKLADYQ